MPQALQLRTYCRDNRRNVAFMEDHIITDNRMFSAV